MSRDLRCSELVLTLQASLSPHEDLQIILDRRRDPASTEAPTDDVEWPVERRRQHHVDLALKRNGFAIVPAAPAVARAQIEPVSFDEPDAGERERFAKIVSFTRRRQPRRWWILAAPVAFILVLFVLMPPVDSLLHQILPEAPPQSSKLTNDLPAVAQAPLITGSSAETPRQPRRGGNSRPEVIARAEKAREVPPGGFEGYAAKISNAAERLASRTVSQTRMWLVNGETRAPRPKRVEGPMEGTQGP